MGEKITQILYKTTPTLGRERNYFKNKTPILYRWTGDSMKVGQGTRVKNI